MRYTRNKCINHNPARKFLAALIPALMGILMGACIPDGEELDDAAPAVVQVDAAVSIDAGVDTTPPDTMIVSGPSNGTVTSATFDFSSNEMNVTYQCKLDNGAWLVCTDPVTFNGLGLGGHSLEVRAVDQANNVDPTPAGWNWTISQSAIPCMTSVQCNQAAPLPVFPFIQGTCVGAAPGVMGHCAYQTVQCDQLAPKASPDTTLWDRWGGHNAPPVQLTSLAATPGVRQNMGWGSCSTRAYKVLAGGAWEPRPICDTYYMWRWPGAAPFMDGAGQWILGQLTPVQCYLAVVFDGNQANLIPWPNNLKELTPRQRALLQAMTPADRTVSWPSDAKMARLKAEAIAQAATVH